MTIKNSGSQLSFSEIESEFGNNPARSLGQYRRDDPSGNFDNASPSGSSCLLYTSPSPRDLTTSRMPSSA